MDPAERTIQEQIAEKNEEMVSLQEQAGNLRRGYTHSPRPSRDDLYFANVGGHLCKRMAKNGKMAFYTKKEGEPDDFLWNEKRKENCPRDRVNDFCPNCRRIPEEEFKSFGIKGSKTRNYWECTCS